LGIKLPNFLKPPGDTPSGKVLFPLLKFETAVGKSFLGLENSILDSTF